MKKDFTLYWLACFASHERRETVTSYNKKRKEGIAKQGNFCLYTDKEMEGSLFTYCKKSVIFALVKSTYCHDNSLRIYRLLKC